MIKCSVSNSQISIGQRVYLEKNKHGTLRYFGKTHFAHGLWCGVELDEETGEHDGMIDNIQYFTCKENHGIFISASELNIINNNSVKISSLFAENFCPTEKYLIDSSIQNFELCNISVSSDSQYTSPKSSRQKSESFVISKGFLAKQLSVINEENIENVKVLKTDDFSHLSTESGLSKCNNVSSIKQAFKPTPKEENVSFQECEENYDSDDSLGILPHLLEDCMSCCDNLVICADNFHVDLNTTVNLPNNIGDIKEWEGDFMDYNTDELVTSSAYVVPKISPSKSDESPVCINTSTPKFSSTPKHETDYSYVIDDAILITQNLSPSLYLSKEDAENGRHLDCSLNKTKDIEVSSVYALPVITNEQTSVVNENRDSGKSILNVTCNIDKPLNSNQILSKTFDNLEFMCGEVCDFPVNSQKLSLMNKTNVQHPSLLDCNQYAIPEETDVVTYDLKSQENYITVFSENILNVTCNILKPSGTNIALSENLVDKYSEYVEKIPSSILNTTTTYSKVTGEHKILEDTALSDLDNKYLENVKSTPSNILNTTTSYSKVTGEDNVLSESLDDKYSENTTNIPSDILNATTTYLKATEGDNVLSESLDGKYSENTANTLSNILNATTTYSEVTVEDSLSESLDNKYLENEKSIPSGILNTTISYSKNAEEKNVINNAENLNITYEKIGLPLELEAKIKVSHPPETISNLNQKMKNSEIVSKDELKSKSSGFGKKLTRKSVGYIGKTTANSEVKDKKARRNSVIGSMCNSLRSTYKDISVKCSNNGNNKKVSFIECPPKSANNLNENMNNFVYLKPECTGITTEEIKPIFEAKFKDNSLLNNDVNFPLLNPEVGKTVVKKPRSSMNVFCKKSSVESFKIPSFKTERKITFPEKRSSAIENQFNQEPNGDLCASSDKTHLKKNTVFSNIAGEEKKQKISRIPGNVFSQKNICTVITPAEINAGNFCKPHSLAMKQCSQQAASRNSLSRSRSASYRPIQKPNLGNTILISGQQSSNQQTTQTVKPSSQEATRKISVSRSRSTSYHPIQKPNLDNTILISGQQSSSQQTTQILKPSNKISSRSSSTLRKPHNWERGSSEKTNLNAVHISDYQSSCEENTQNTAHKFVPKGTSQIPLSRIPSISRGNKKQASEVISVMTPRRSESTSYKRKNHPKYNLR